MSGEPLPDMPDTSGSYFSDPTTDKAIGMQALKIDGESFDGSKISVDPSDGTPRVFVFVAHWCPHCQRELPEIEAWIKAGKLPKNVEIIVVSTAVNEPRGNYPVSNWIAKEDITVSADGFGAGEGQSLERPFGHANPGELAAPAGAPVAVGGGGGGAAAMPPRPEWRP